MNKEREIAEKMIADAEKMAKEGRAKLAQLDKPSVTYSIADRFFRHENEKHMLMVSHGKVAMICIADGHQYSHGEQPVTDIKKITKAEFSRIVDSNAYAFTRYWDNRKKVYTDGRGEDLEEFAVDDLKMWLDTQYGSPMVKLDAHWSAQRTFTLKEATEIHQKLGQLIDTAKRRQK